MNIYAVQFRRPHAHIELTPVPITWDFKLLFSMLIGLDDHQVSSGSIKILTEILLFLISMMQLYFNLK